MFDTEFLLFLISLVIIVIGLITGYVIRFLIEKKTIKNAKDQAHQIISNAKESIEIKRREALLEAKDLLIKEKSKFEKDAKEHLYEVKQLEKRVLRKEENLEKKIDSIEKKERSFEQKEQELIIKENKLAGEKEHLQKHLEDTANLSRDAAKEIIIEQVKAEALKESQKFVAKLEHEAKLKADKEAKQIIISSIQRLAPEVSQGASISSVSLPSDEMKGRIIGREGRNIRALEVATGVDIIIDDTPEAIVLSCFDPVRREKARIAIERLVSDGRIHPARIEEIVNKVSKEIDKIIFEEGDKACFELGIQNMSPELQRYVGRLKYRYSYGQNILNHSKEVARLCGIMAAEVGINVDRCIRGGLLHDIGKGISIGDGEHARVGADIAKKYGEDKVVVNSIISHHFDVEPAYLESIIVQAGDAMSASRPGARRESFDDYITRLTNLEAIANGFPGVEKAFAIQAGRELRIIVNNDKVSDTEAKETAKSIAKKIEDEMRYPGQVRVALIRETRIVEYAR